MLFSLFLFAVTLIIAPLNDLVVINAWAQEWVPLAEGRLEHFWFVSLERYGQGDLLESSPTFAVDSTDGSSCFAVNTMEVVFGDIFANPNEYFRVIVQQEDSTRFQGTLLEIGNVL